MIIDRAIRGTVPALALPPGALSGEARSIVHRVASGAVDRHLSAMRAAEVCGLHRPSVVKAIDARARHVAGGE
tara:strand:- start:419 stop:637 length:219 start_codon:yes stop_codon:yes gene_type:complete